MGNYELGLVSVVMPTYKRSEKLTRAIESVLNQTYKNIELLLVNDNDPTDCYTQDLKDRVAKYQDDSRFKLIIQEKHINGAVARNVGIKKARGEYIAFLDDDDWWEREKLEKQISLLNSLGEEYGGVSCKYKFVNESGKVIGESKKYRGGYIYKDILRLQTDVTTCSLLLRHECLDKTGYFDENLTRHQDFQLLINFTYAFMLEELDEYELNIDVSDTQNRPDGQKLLEHKKKFLKSINPVLSTLAKSEADEIMAIHMFEVGYVFAKGKEYGKSIKYIVKGFRTPRSSYYVLKKCVEKIQTMSKRGRIR